MAFDRCSMGIRVVAVDIGSVRPSSKFAWAAFDAPGRDLIAVGTDPETAVSALAPGLLAGAQAALLLEAPMSVPVPDGQPGAWGRLGKARDGEGNRPWSAGAGRWRAGDRAGAGCMDAAPARGHGARAGSDDTARDPGGVAARSCCWPRRSSPRPASLSRCQQARMLLMRRRPGWRWSRSWTAPRRSPPPCAARRRTRSTCWRRWRYGPGCGLTSLSCTLRSLSLPPVLSRRRPLMKCRAGRWMTLCI